MTDTPQQTQSTDRSGKEQAGSGEAVFRYYKIRFRQQGQEVTASCQQGEYHHGNRVMVRTDQGLEPAMIVGRAFGPCEGDADRPVHHRIVRLANAEEVQKCEHLPQLERQALLLCRRQVEALKLPMHLVRVERFFNGSKIIFYFTAESRVDFRELVKLLVQEFRIRVEMRQIGVRHETQMVGGLGTCGRELCCSSFLTKFDSVSIKMAKTQDLPLNPAKISGCCNRLLCCLTYEYETYRVMKKSMPRVGRTILFEEKPYRVVRQMPLLGKVLAIAPDGEAREFVEEEWPSAEAPPKLPGKKGPGKRGSSAKQPIDIWGILGTAKND